MSISSTFNQYRQSRAISGVGGENIDASTTVIAEPGRFEVDGTLRGSVSAAGLAGRSVLNDVIFGGADVQSVAIRYNADVGRVRSEFNNVLEGQFDSIRDRFDSISRAADVLGIDIPSTPNNVLDDIRNDLANFPTDTVPLTISYPPIGEVGGESPVEFGFSRDIPTITIPVIDSGALDRLPDIPFAVTFDTTSPLQGAFGEGRREITFEIPASAFIETEEIDAGNIPCVELNPDIDEQISNIDSELRSARGEITSDLDNIRSVRDDLLSEAGTGSLSNIGSARLGDITGDRLQEFRNRLNQNEPPSLNINSLSSQVQDLRNRIQDLSPNCRSEFSSDIDSLESLLNTIESRLGEVQSIRDRIDSTLSGDRVINCEVRFDSISSSLDNLESIVGTAPSIGDFETTDPQALLDRVRDLESDITSEIPSDSPCRDRFLSRANSIQGDLRGVLSERSGLGCSDVPRSVRNAVSGIEQNVNDFTGLDMSSRREDRFNNLLQETEELEQEVQDRVQDDNPCKQQLLSRIRSGRERLNRAETRRPELIPCGEQFSGIENQVDSLEDQVVGIGAALSEGEIEGIVSNAESIFNQIENNIPSDNPCRGRLAGRVESAITQLQRQERSARVRTIIPEERRQEARQQVEELRGRLEQITAQLS